MKNNGIYSRLVTQQNELEESAVLGGGQVG